MDSYVCYEDDNLFTCMDLEVMEQDIIYNVSMDLSVQPSLDLMDNSQSFNNVWSQHFVDNELDITYAEAQKVESSVYPECSSNQINSHVIEAADISGLLEQFEEVSQSFSSINEGQSQDGFQSSGDLRRCASLPLELSSISTLHPAEISNLNSVPIFEMSSPSTVHAPEISSVGVVQTPGISSVGAVQASGISSQSSVPIFEISSQGTLEPSGISSVGAFETPGISCAVETPGISSISAVQPTGRLSLCSGQQDSNNLSDPECTCDKNGNVPNKELTEDVIKKLKTSKKPKSAVLLPIMDLAKQGRGRAVPSGHAVAMPANCSPRIQRVMMQNAALIESFAFTETKGKVQSLVIEVPQDKNEVSDIAQIEIENTPKLPNEIDNVNECGHHNVQMLDHDYSMYIDSCNASVRNIEWSSNNNDMEDGEVLDDTITIHDKTLNSNEEIKDEEDCTMFFNKLPSYYTALSIPRKQTKKSVSSVARRGGITLHDYFERDPSPVRDDASMYNKVPEYFSSFTNSTKYDEIQVINKQNSDESKTSSGYSSQNPSPVSSLQPSKTGSSRSSSNSRLNSPDGDSRQSRHKSKDGDSGHSRHKSKRKRNLSVLGSEYSSSDCSCSRSSCSRSSSSSRSSSCSCSSSRSSSCSTCVSRSSSASSTSSTLESHVSDRALRKERDFRGERSAKSRGRSRSQARGRRSSKARRSRSYSWSPVKHVRSRSRSSSFSASRYYRSRSRSSSTRRCKVLRDSHERSLERLRIERKKEKEEDKVKQMKERRIVYVGGLPASYSRHQLRSAFSRFGEIEQVQLHFREHGDNYGFVTFVYKCDAFAAIERGKTVRGLEKFDLCFGGRRQFCDVEYADLDGNKEIEEEYDTKPQKHCSLSNFDELLKQAKARVKS